jgi:spermidine/putrescine-binding protein
VVRRPNTRAALVGILVIAALGTAGSVAASTHKAAAGPFAGQTLVVANWKDYGSDMPWAVKQFQQQTGAKVVHQYFNSEEQLLSMLRTGGIGKIDVVLPNLAYVQPAVAQNLLQPIDVKKISSWSQLIPALKAQSGLRSGGKFYGVPWMWGLTSLAYNTTAIPEKITSWAALWDPKYKGKVAFFDDPTTAVMTAALYLGQNPYKPDLAKVRTALSELKKNSKLFWASADDWTKAFSTKSIVIGNLWSGLAGTQIGHGDPVAFVLPKEGSVGWLDSWAIARDAPHRDLAYAWISFMTSKAYQSRWAKDPNRSSPAPANQAAQATLSKAVINRIQAHPEWVAKLTLQKAIPQKTLQEWTQLWQEIKAG